MSFRSLALVVLSASAFASGCASTINARTYGRADVPKAVESDGDATIARLYSRTNPLVCLDPAAQMTSAEALKARELAWRQDVREDDSWLPGLQPPSMIHRAPIAEYPRDMVRDGDSGAVLLLLLIEADGSVADVLVVCSTHNRLAGLAATAARQNRYSPARLEGRGLRSVALLPYAYSVGR